MIGTEPKVDGQRSRASVVMDAAGEVERQAFDQHRRFVELPILADDLSQPPEFCAVL